MPIDGDFHHCHRRSHQARWPRRRRLGRSDYQDGALCYTYSRSQQTICVLAKAADYSYGNDDNPPQVTGDGYVLGFELGRRCSASR